MQAMNFQTLAVAVLVAASFAYAAWTLMPQALRAMCAKQMLRLPLPVGLRAWLLAASTASAGGGCSGCAKAPPEITGGTLTAKAKPLVFHPRKAK
jgi:hypothetical protein